MLDAGRSLVSSLGGGQLVHPILELLEGILKQKKGAVYGVANVILLLSVTSVSPNFYSQLTSKQELRRRRQPTAIAAMKTSQSEYTSLDSIV